VHGSLQAGGHGLALDASTACCNSRVSPTPLANVVTGVIRAALVTAGISSCGLVFSFCTAAGGDLSKSANAFSQQSEGSILMENRACAEIQQLR